MNVIWSALAVRHLQQVMNYIVDDSPRGAQTVRRRILATVSRIGLMPLSGREGRIHETREAIVPDTSYIVIYRVQEQGVEIIGLWHAAREWPDFF